ncbi:MAG: Ig-like domain-containing protein [Luteolibacter sp.]
MKILAVLLALTVTASAQKLVGWNNLGMHCMDDDYSVFSILPPYNTLDAQLIDASGKLVRNTTGYTVTYEAVADPDGSINSTSIGKSTFWDYSQALFGANLPADTGLAGKQMPGPANQPQSLDFSGVMNWFEGLGIPLTPIDDAGHSNPYPLMRLTAKNSAGTVLATTDVVLPVSGEMNCRACHSSGSGPAARPAAGWVNEPQVSRNYRLNILLLHDERHLGSSVYTAALAAKGYPADGLYSSVIDHQKPVLCAACHDSEALGTGGFPGVPPLTRSLHSLHANVIGPDTGLPLDHVANRSSCYQCHPGSETKCLRGAMGAAVAADGSSAMQCQSCHGTMSQVGAANRRGWLDEPQCASCHTGTATQNAGQLRFDSVFDGTGAVRTPVVPVFASNPNTPAAGISLYRYSKGHGDLSCSACHGSTHAEFPALHRNDNLQNQKLQGHAGVLASCTACHTTMPRTTSGGPHGMHSIDSTWATGHADIVETSGTASCRACHGSNDRGTPLSRVFVDHSITTKFGTRTFTAGREVSCYDCHNGASQEGATSRTAPVVSNASLQVPAGGSASLNLSATGTTPVFKILRQPAHGSVALSGKVATYFPEAGFSGPDSFLFTASDAGGYIDAWAPAIVSVNVGSVSATLDRDGDQIPDVIEYALGLSPDFPTLADARSPFFKAIGGTNYWTLRVPRAPSPGDATPVIEYSSDLTNWVPGTLLSNTPFLLEARDPDPAITHAKRFVRIRAQH